MRAKARKVRAEVARHPPVLHRAGQRARQGREAAARLASYQRLGARQRRLGRGQPVADAVEPKVEDPAEREGGETEAGAARPSVPEREVALHAPPRHRLDHRRDEPSPMSAGARPQRRPSAARIAGPRARPQSGSAGWSLGLSGGAGREGAQRHHGGAGHHQRVGGEPAAVTAGAQAGRPVAS